MVYTIGLLPASGSASRVNGIPKFALPYNNSTCLLQYHISQMLEAADEIRVCTRQSWLPILDELQVQKDVEISVMEPTSMNDAIFSMMEESTRGSAQYVIGMPDTVWTNTATNPYLKLATFETTSEVTLLTSPFREALRGKVGQVKVSPQGLVEAVIDKKVECNFNAIWTAFRMNHFVLDRDYSSPSDSFRELIQANKSIDATHFDGDYHDLGSIEGIRMFYASTETQATE